MEPGFEIDPNGLLKPRRLTLAQWLREGLRAGLLLRPRVGGSEPNPLQVGALVLIVALIDIALGRFEVMGEAAFDLRGALAPWWSTAAMLLIAWWGLPRRDEHLQRPSGLPAWFALWMGAVILPSLVAQVLTLAQLHEALPAFLSEFEWEGWLLYGGLWLWTVAAVVRLLHSFAVPPLRLAVVSACMIGIFALSAWQFPDRPWQPVMAQAEPEAANRMQLSQPVIEAQQATLERTLQGVAPHREGIVDVYGIVFSPYAEGEVFMRESRMVADLLAERFDAQGHVIHLANNAATPESIAWATPDNLDRAVDAIAAKMDRENDVLVVYLTSHGARDFKLAAANPPLEVEPLSPGDLRRALDKAGIRNRVIAVSACYSGGWIGPLSSESTLVMTAADADHTSYGCGSRSKLTFFGRAVFDEQLRKTHSFEQAFAQAVPVIKQREIEGNKPDGFSNPQISVGDRIRPVLHELEQRLGTRPG
ncbi:C13 family peptidase [Caenimonas koreensis]|uniref:Peptidase C13 family protein n=1 Tax=Caenimonas koreensis DSM 17982 TaxID=1121255 RepID=A0A844B417_9BURK|nr:C13 family peptidase [Caenimonas koreensis]MRD46287.1 hypothetical protein [Caenimonas koreensis DSM 17982]